MRTYNDDEPYFLANAILPPKQYRWAPKEDITAHELALCMPVLMSIGNYGIEYFIDALPDNARRHFEVVKG
jgi:hypothetical protein